MLKITRASSVLRTAHFPTVQRDATRSLAVAYTNTAPDPRIDAHALDWVDAAKGAFGIRWHYVVRTDGRVEIGRDPGTRSTRSRNYAAITEGIHIGIVGGMDPETGKRIDSTTPEQEVAVEELMQAIADALNVPLEVHDSRDRWVKHTGPTPEEIIEEQDAALDAAERQYLADF